VDRFIKHRLPYPRNMASARIIRGRRVARHQGYGVLIYSIPPNVLQHEISFLIATGLLAAAAPKAKGVCRRGLPAPYTCLIVYNIKLASPALLQVCWRRSRPRPRRSASRLRSPQGVCGSAAPCRPTPRKLPPVATTWRAPRSRASAQRRRMPS
jgi:hypothetical protein